MVQISALFSRMCYTILNKNYNIHMLGFILAPIKTEQKNC